MMVATGLKDNGAVMKRQNQNGTLKDNSDVIQPAPHHLYYRDSGNKGKQLLSGQSLQESF